MYWENLSDKAQNEVLSSGKLYEDAIECFNKHLTVSDNHRTVVLLDSISTLPINEPLKRAFIMNADYFTQGMSHEEALEKNLGEDGFVSGKAYAKYHKSYNSLSSRPDYDGYLTLAEANEWYRNGNGDPLFADLGKINMSNLYSLGEKYVGESKPISLFKASMDVNDALVYGSFGMTRYPNHQVRASRDRYDFEMHEGNSISIWARNQATKIGEWVAGYGTPYEINFYGSKILKPRWPWTK
jgi:hypothetical protein